MWIIYSKTWGMLECDAVYSSKSFPGQVTVHGVKRNGETMREKAYFPVHDLTALIPPKGGGASDVLQVHSRRLCRR